MTPEKEFLAAYDAHSPSVYRHAYFRTSRKEVAEDLVQETFFKSWRYVAQGGEIKNYKAFFLRTLNNLLVDYYRSRAKDPFYLEDMIKGDIADREDKKISEREAEKIILKESLSKLEEEQRNILWWRYIDGLSAKEVADIVGKTPANINVLAHRALKSLREKMKYV